MGGRGLPLARRRRRRAGTAAHGSRPASRCRVRRPPRWAHCAGFGEAADQRHVALVTSTSPPPSAPAPTRPGAGRRPVPHATRER